MSDNIHNTLLCNEDNIGSTIRESISTINDTPLPALEWINSRYVPTPTIIEAAQALYRKHGVEDISRNDAGAKNLTITTAAISDIIDQCKKNNEKAICFVTGVPGAGKTLAGLNIANKRQCVVIQQNCVGLHSWVNSKDRWNNEPVQLPSHYLFSFHLDAVNQGISCQLKGISIRESYFTLQI